MYTLPNGLTFEMIALYRTIPCLHSFSLPSYVLLDCSFDRLSPSVSVSLENYECTSLRLWLAIKKFVPLLVIYG